MHFTSLFLLLVPASAFTSKSTGASISTELSASSTREPDSFETRKKLEYGEESRRYRRTVYTHDDWVIHRSPDRFYKNIITTTSSGIYKNVARETLAIVGVSVLVILWNMATGGYTDLNGIQQDAFIQNTFLPTISVPLTPFTMSSPFLGYLLGKSSNRCY
jgi:putative membrane protein